MANPNDPALHSWIDISPTSDFPLQNLPFGVFETEDYGPHLGVAIGSYVLDLYTVSQFGFFEDLDLAGQQPQVFRSPSLNAFIALGQPAWRAVRQRVSELLRHDNPALRDSEEVMRACLVRQRDARMLLPVQPGRYSRLGGSLAHATNVSALLAPTLPLPPTWHQAPSSYAGSAGSVLLSGAAVPLPGAASGHLDFTLELAYVGGHPTLEAADTLSVQQAEGAVFGVALLTGWWNRSAPEADVVASALGVGQLVASSLAPWVVPLDALEPFRTAGPTQLPEPLPYLQQSGLHHFDVQLEATLTPADGPATTLVTTNARHLYWSAAQQLTYEYHQGYPLHPGDLYASGPISGPTPDSAGSLLELSQHGTQPVPLNNGSSRTYLQPGDTVTVCGFGKADEVRIGFGEVVGSVE